MSFFHSPLSCHEPKPLFLPSIKTRQTEIICIINCIFETTVWKIPKMLELCMDLFYISGYQILCIFDLFHSYRWRAQMKSQSEYSEAAGL